MCSITLPAKHHSQRGGDRLADCFFGGGRGRAGHLWGPAQWSQRPYDVRGNELGALAQWMAQEEITVFHATPSLYRYLVAALGEQPGAGAFPSCAW